MQQTTGLQVIIASSKRFQVYTGSPSERLCEILFVFVELCVLEMFNRDAGMRNYYFDLAVRKLLFQLF